MLRKRRSFNPKRQLAQALPADLRSLANSVRYGGSPEHKRAHGDFGLIPPAAPRADKTLCDGAGVLRRAEAEALLRKGIERGFISKQQRGRFPQNVWAVTEQDVPLEAQLDNMGQGNYHGYPMPDTDPLREEVLSRWRH
jgi:hypothetical protein